MNSSRVKIARVVDGVVEILQGNEYFPADDVLMLNAGEENSDGIVIINGLISRYMTNTQLDTAYILNQLLSVVENVIAISDNATYVIAATGGVNGKIPAFASVTAQLNTIKDDIEEHKII